MFQHEAPGLIVDPDRTALVLTDLHNDFLDPGGKAYPLIAATLEKNDTANNIEKLLRAAKQAGLRTFLSPHFYYPTEQAWTARLSPLEDFAHRAGLLARAGAFTLDGFEGSGADFPARYKPYLFDAQTVIVSPHKAYGASTNDLLLQLRRHGIDRMILAGPVGNLCVEGHMRDLIEHGFEVAMVRDATAGAENEEGCGYQAAMINWRFMAHAVWSTAEAVALIDSAGSGIATHVA